MVVAHHLVWTAYGWWLPNDPRGSMSREIRVESVAALGPPHYGRKPVQPRSSVIREFYDEASRVLRHAPLTLDDVDVRIVSAAFAETITRRRYTCYACAIMPDHVHLLVRKHRDPAEMMIAEFQRASAVALLAHGRRPSCHPVWGGRGWKVFLNGRRDVERVVEYVRLNPIKAHLPAQAWPFVAAYDGWLPGGHPETRCSAKPQAERRPR